MSTSISEFPVMLTIAFSSWVAFTAGSDVFSTIKRAYLRTELYRMKSAVHKMFLVLRNRQSHNHKLELSLLEKEQVLDKEILNKGVEINFCAKEAAFLLFISLICSVCVHSVLF